MIPVEFAGNRPKIFPVIRTSRQRFRSFFRAFAVVLGGWTRGNNRSDASRPVGIKSLEREKQCPSSCVAVGLVVAVVLAVVAGLVVVVALAVAGVLAVADALAAAGGSVVADASADQFGQLTQSA